MVANQSRVDELAQNQRHFQEQLNELAERQTSHSESQNKIQEQLEALMKKQSYDQTNNNISMQKLQASIDQMFEQMSSRQPESVLGQAPTPPPTIGGSTPIRFGDIPFAEGSNSRPVTQLHQESNAANVLVRAQNPNSNLKVDFPRFNGKDPHCWLIQCENYFRVIDVTESQKPYLAATCFDDEAKHWFSTFIIEHNTMIWRFQIGRAHV